LRLFEPFRDACATGASPAAVAGWDKHPESLMERVAAQLSD
jgi:hypothetical protein